MNPERVCDWRTSFNQQCDHYTSLFYINIANLYVSIIVSLICLVTLLVRLFYFKTKLFRPPPPSSPSWFWFDQSNMILLAGGLHFIAKSSFSATVLYTSAPFYITGALYDFSYVLGFIPLTYYYMATVIAISNTKIIDSSGYQKVVDIFRIIIPFVMFTASLMPIFFGISYYLGLRSFAISYNMETILFAIWAFLLVVLIFAVNHLSFKLLRNIKSSIKMEESRSSKEASKLKKVYSQTKGTIFFFNILTGSILCNMIIFASIRDILWATPWANIVFCIGFNFVAAGLGILHPISLLYKDFNYQEKRISKQGSSVNNSLNSVRDSSARDSSTQAISIRIPSVEEHIMDQFLKESETN